VSLKTDEHWKKEMLKKEDALSLRGILYLDADFE